MTKRLELAPLEPKFFERTIKLGNDVHGDDYLNDGILQKIYKKSIKDGHNCSFVMLDTAKELSEEKVVGFRLTYAPGNWLVDEWCTSELWNLPIEQLCYFKSSTVDSNYLRMGIAKKMLAASIEVTKKLGAKGGICHTWMQSPGNAAYEYFVRCGGTLLKTHPNRWLEDSYAGYKCIVCGADVYCHCDAGEMILRFGD
ncbi:MAG: GNAT family N-acetyltransferase [Kangiellaceae bacterium]|nr:GNAT family N-acetyltransferase [Kangiellaceae bacterium]